jgi:teichuronic acid biosynthesis glycosyltransferase TuaC
LLTSFNEGSPQFIKEAMACNCPIVSTDVGDVNEIIGKTDGCFICGFNKEDVKEKIEICLEFAEKNGRTDGRNHLIKAGLTSDHISAKVMDVYKLITSQGAYIKF